MVIKKMNRVFHKHSRWLFGAFTLIIIVSFLGFLTPGTFGLGGFSSPDSTVVGSVYGKEVTYGELRKEKRSLAALFREVPDEMALFMLAQKAKADQLAIAVSDDELKTFLQQEFVNKEGKYDSALYRQHMDALRANGFTEEEVLDGFRSICLGRKLQMLAANSVVVSDVEAKAIYRQYNTRFVGKIYTVKPQESAAEIPMEEVQKFFTANAKNYIIDGSISALVVEFPFANYLAEVQKTEKDPAKATAAAKDLAKAAAKKFSDDVYDQLKTLPEKEQSAAFQKILADQKLTAKEEKFSFNGNMNVKDLEQLKYALLKAEEPARVSDPATEEKAVLVGLVTTRVEPRQAEFNEVVKKVYQDCKAERIQTATEEKAKEFAQKYNECKDDAARAALLKQLPVAKTEDISLTVMESSMNRAQASFLGAAFAIAPKQAASVGDAVLVLAKREVPQENISEEELMLYRFLALQNKQELAVAELQEDIATHCQYRAPGSDAEK